MPKNTNSNIQERTPTILEGRLTLRISEAAEALGVSETTVRRMIRRQLVTTLRVLRVHLIPVAQLRALIGGK